MELLETSLHPSLWLQENLGQVVFNCPERQIEQQVGEAAKCPPTTANTPSSCLLLWHQIPAFFITLYCFIFFLRLFFLKLQCLLLPDIGSHTALFLPYSLSLKKIFLLEVQLIYNVLISGVQQSELYVLFLRILLLRGPSQSTESVPSAPPQVLAGHWLYSSVSLNPNLAIYPLFLPPCEL